MPSQKHLHLLKRLKDDYKKTVVIVTHDHRIGQIADTVMNIVDGRITATITGKDFSASIATSTESRSSPS